jgi:hypothetical protein
MVLVAGDVAVAAEAAELVGALSAAACPSVEVAVNGVQPLRLFIRSPTAEYLRFDVNSSHTWLSASRCTPAFCHTALRAPHISSSATTLHAFGNVKIHPSIS